MAKELRYALITAFGLAVAGCGHQNTPEPCSIPLAQRDLTSLKEGFVSLATKTNELLDIVPIAAPVDPSIVERKDSLEQGAKELLGLTEAIAETSGVNNATQDKAMQIRGELISKYGCPAKTMSLERSLN